LPRTTNASFWSGGAPRGILMGGGTRQDGEVFCVEHVVVCKMYVHKCMMSFNTRGLRVKNKFTEVNPRPPSENRGRWASLRGKLHAVSGLYSFPRKVGHPPDMETSITPLSRLVKSLILLGIVLGLEWTIWLSVSGIRLAMKGRVDFRNLYTAACMVRTGHSRQLYDYDSELAFQNSLVSPQPKAMLYLRPAYHSLSFIPFSFLPYKAAYFAFLVFNGGLLVVSYRLLRSQLNSLATVWKFLPAAMFLLFIPIIFSLLQGQDSIEFLALMALAFVSLKRGHEGWAGLLVGVGIWKLQILAPLGLLFLLWKRWRFVAGLSVTAVLCLSVSAWLVGIAQLGTYFHTLMEIKGVADTGQFGHSQYAVVVSAMPSLRGLLFALLHAHASPSVLFVLHLLIAFLVLILAAWFHRNARRSSDLFLIAITASCFVSYYLFVHDLSMVVIPIVLAMDRCLAVGSGGDKYQAWMAPSAAVMFMAPACAFFSPAHLYLVSIPLLIFLLTLSSFTFRARKPSDRLTTKQGHRMPGGPPFPRTN